MDPVCSPLMKCLKQERRKNNMIKEPQQEITKWNKYEGKNVKAANDFQSYL